VTMDDTSRAYGETNPDLTFTITSGNLVNGDANDALAVVASTTPSNVSPVGEYPITGSSTSANYDVTIEEGTLTVTKAASEWPSGTVKEFNLVYGDDLNELNLDERFVFEAPTTKDDKPNAGDHDYNVTFTESENHSAVQETITVNVAKRPVTVTMDDTSRVYGEANPATFGFTITSGNLVNGDANAALAVVGSTTATEASPVDEYPITGTSTSANYDVTIEEGTLTVVKKTLEEFPALEGTYSMTYGELLADAQPELPAGYTFDHPTHQPLAAGDINVAVSFENEFTNKIEGTVTVTVQKKPITVTITEGQTMTWTGNGWTISECLYTVSDDYVFGDTFHTAFTGSFGGLPTDAAVGTYPITQGEFTSTNYEITFVGASLEITKTTPPARQISVQTVTPTSVTLRGFPNFEYSIDGGDTWQDETLFGGLDPDTDYTFLGRVKESATNEAGETSTVSARTLEAGYGITLSETGTVSLGSATFGYGEPSAHSVDVSNIGNMPTGVMNVTLVGDDADAFTLSVDELASLDVDGTAPGAFLVSSAMGLDAGVYSVIVRVSNANVTAEFEMTFTVLKAAGT